MHELEASGVFVSFCFGGLRHRCFSAFSHSSGGAWRGGTGQTARRTISVFRRVGQFASCLLRGSDFERIRIIA